VAENQGSAKKTETFSGPKQGTIWESNQKDQHGDKSYTRSISAVRQRNRAVSARKDTKKAPRNCSVAPNPGDGPIKAGKEKEVRRTKKRLTLVAMRLQTCRRGKKKVGFAKPKKENILRV